MYESNLTCITHVLPQNQQNDILVKLTELLANNISLFHHMIHWPLSYRASKKKTSKSERKCHEYDSRYGTTPTDVQPSILCCHTTCEPNTYPAKHSGVLFIYLFIENCESYTDKDQKAEFHCTNTLNWYNLYFLLQRCYVTCIIHICISLSTLTF